MSITYDYDVFISCAFEDKFYAQTLARKLQELGFLVWCDAAESVAVPSPPRPRAEAIENSATCVLLMGARGKQPWLDDAVRDTIRSRVNRTHGLFRVVTVALPGADVDVVRRRTGSYMKRFDGVRWPEAVVHFEESLDEEATLHELVLSIRGIAPCGQADWLEEDFGEYMRSRARNVLNIDWLRLFLDFTPAALNTSVRNDEGLYYLSVVNPVEATEGGHGDAGTFGRVHLVDESSAISQPNCATPEELKHQSLPSEVPASLLTSISRHAATVAIVLIIVALHIGTSIYVWQVYLTHYNGRDNPLKQANNNQNAVQNRNSAPDVLVNANEDLKVHDKEESQKTEGTGLGEKRPYPRSLTRWAGDTPKVRLASHPPDAPTVRPSASGTSTALKTQLFEPGGPETVNPHAEEYRKAFANISGIFIKNLDGRVVNEETFLKTFGEALGGEGINVFFRKEDRHLASLSAEMHVVSNESKDGGYGIVILTVKNQSGLVVGECYARIRDHLNDKVLQAEQVARELNRQILSYVEDARDRVPEPKPRSGPRGVGTAG